MTEGRVRFREELQDRSAMLALDEEEELEEDWEEDDEWDDEDEDDDDWEEDDEEDDEWEWEEDDDDDVGSRKGEKTVWNLIAA